MKLLLSAFFSPLRSVNFKIIRLSTRIWEKFLTVAQSRNLIFFSRLVETCSNKNNHTWKFSENSIVALKISSDCSQFPLKCEKRKSSHIDDSEKSFETFGNWESLTLIEFEVKFFLPWFLRLSTTVFVSRLVSKFWWYKESGAFE